MANALLTRRVRFSAAHRYYRPEWSEAENRHRFGACANPFGHGHNYALDVTVQGEIDEATGFCVELPALDAILQREVVERFDHQHINFAVPEFGEGGWIPSTENLTRYLWPRISAALPPGARLLRLRLHEDDSLYVDYNGEGAGGALGDAAPPDEQTHTHE
jgi:6-pyruvoyltetrahydropterin/6-carboxytetrahydropterin synthase